MRVLSTLISSFVFASVLEHPKLFARAQATGIASDTFAGARKELTGREAISSVVATFDIPHVRGHSNSGAFVGVTFSSSAECGSTSISAGVLIYINPHGVPVYTPVYQVHPSENIQGDLDVNQRPTFPGDSMAVFIVAGLSQGIVVIMNLTRGWKMEVSVKTSISCGRVAEWKVASIIVNTSNRIPLPRFGEVTFRDARVVTAFNYVTPAGHGSTLLGLFGADGTKMVDVEVHGDFILHIKQF